MSFQNASGISLSEPGRGFRIHLFFFADITLVILIIAIFSPCIAKLSSFNLSQCETSQIYLKYDIGG